MKTESDAISVPLFVPADRPDRFEKAVAAGPDAVIIDLEDAVSPSNKEAARQGLREALTQLGPLSLPVMVRINAVNTRWHEADLRAVKELPVDALMLAKAESSEIVAGIRTATGLPVFALIESVLGLSKAKEIACASDRLVFGSIDFAADCGCAHTRDALLLARTQLVIAARLANQAAPIDGVTTDIRDPKSLMDDACYAFALGFSGKLLIHPNQVSKAREGFLPSLAQVAWAEKVVDAVGESDSAVQLDGAMIDRPVVLRAQQILARIALARRVEKDCKR